jgi:hypothetical protein
MALRYLSGSVTAVAIVFGLTTGPAYSQQRDGGLLPLKESGMVTVAGCLLRGNQVKDGDSDKYVLANLQKGPVANAPEQTCTADTGATAVQLDNPDKGNINESMLGKWVEVSGRLERETSGDNILRELDVTSARLLTAEAPLNAAASAPEPAPQAVAPPAAAEPSPAPAPIATSGQADADLPKTASVEPLIAMLGLLAFAGALVLRSFRTRQRA